MNERRTAGRFIGRAAELETLSTALARASGGRPSVVVVGGEAGVGKSRLLAEFVAALPAATRAVVAHCVPYQDGGVPFSPWGEVVRRLGPGLDAAGGAGGESTRDRRAQFFEQVRTVVAGAATAPLVIAVEDLHWADTSTCDLLAFLLANLLDEPVLTILTYRSDDLPPGAELHTFLAELCRRTGADRLELARFTRDEVAAKLADLCGERPPVDLVDVIWQRGDGNPFFTEELAATTASGDVALGVTLRDILTGRLAGLSPGAQRVVRTAAAAGAGGVAHGTLVAVLGDDGGELDGWLREAAERHVLVLDQATGVWVFRHALLREVADADLLPGERAGVHARYARALVGEDPDGVPEGQAAELARHWRAAGDRERAFRASIVAGEVAERLFGFAEAEDHYLTALDLHDRDAADPQPGPLLLDLYRRSARAAHLAGDHTRAAELLDDASSVDGTSAVTRGVLLAGRGRYLRAAGETAEALRVHEEACRLVPDVPWSQARAEVMSAYAEALLRASRYRESLGVAQDALAHARAVGAGAAEGEALAAAGFALAMLDDDGAGIDCLRRALAVAQDGGRPDEVGRAYLDLTDLLAGPLNRVEEAVSLALEGAESARELGTGRTYGVSLLSVAANGLFRLGRWDEADRIIDAVLDQRPSGAVAIALYLAEGRLAVGRGRFQQAAHSLAMASTLCARAPDLRFTAPLRTLMAGLALWEGRLEAARQAVADGLAAAGHAEDPWHLAPLVWHGLRVESELAAEARAQRDAGAAAAALASAQGLVGRMDELVAGAARLPRASRQFAEAYELLCHAELSRVTGQPGCEPWLRAAEAWTVVGQPYPAAYARYRAADALLAQRQGRTEPARLLADAYRTAVDLGARPFAAEIEALAARARIELEAADGGSAAAPSLEPPGVLDRFALTLREVEVLRLVARGQTNREIAATLFISAKTASVHVSNILAKLGVATRVEAAAVALRSGIDGPVQAVAEI